MMWRKRWLAFGMALLMLLAPLGVSQAQGEQDGYRLRYAFTLEAENCLELWERLTGELLGAEDRRIAQVAFSLINAQELDIQTGMNGEQLRAAVLLSGQEMLYFRHDVAANRQVITSSLFPGVALESALADMLRVQQTFWQMDVEGLYADLSANTERWLASLDRQEEQGTFLGSVISGANQRVTYSVDDRDLAALVDAWVQTLLLRPDAVALLDAWLGEGSGESYLLMLEAFNRQVALDNQYAYTVSLFFHGDALVGLTVSGGMRDSQERPWQLTLGWDDASLDLLATVPDGSDDWLMRYTGVFGAADGTETQQLRLLCCPAGTGYDAASQGQAYGQMGLDWSQHTTVDDGVQETVLQGEAFVRAEDLTLTVPFFGEATKDLETLALDCGVSFYADDGDTVLGTVTCAGERTEIAPAPDEEGMTVLSLSEDYTERTEWQNALEQGYQQLMLRMFKAFPSDAIDLITQWVLEQQ